MTEVYVKVISRAPNATCWSTRLLGYVEENNPDLNFWLISDNTLVELDTELAADTYLRDMGFGKRTPLPPRDVPTLIFTDRFTDEELLAAFAIAPALVLRLAFSQEVNVLDPRITNAIDGLIAAQVIDEERRDALLARGSYAT